MHHKHLWDADGYCDCCEGDCDCEEGEEESALFDADELGLDPERDGERRYHEEE